MSTWHHGGEHAGSNLGVLVSSSAGRPGAGYADEGRFALHARLPEEIEFPPSQWDLLPVGGSCWPIWPALHHG